MLSRQEHWRSGALTYPIGNTANEEMVQTTTAMATHYEKISPPGGAFAED
jgi:hypothetical protein